MADPEHLRIFKQGVGPWNRWRTEKPAWIVDLSIADLSDATLRAAYLRSLSDGWGYRVYLHDANFSGVNLSNAKLNGVDFRGADLSGADFRKAKLMGANFSRAKLKGADFSGADLSAAVLHQAELNNALLIGTNLENADLTGCHVYGVSAWNLNLHNAVQKNIIITPQEESTIQVDRLDVAQFIYLLLNNLEIRHVIDTITSKVVLILGRFSEERKVVLDALRNALRERDYLPILFDWEKPSSRDITETVSTLAHMSKFVIADITDAKSIPQELMAIVPNLPSVPVQPLLLASQSEYGMFEHFKRYAWVLPVALYKSQDELLGLLEHSVIVPAETKLKEIRAASAVSSARIGFPSV